MKLDLSKTGYASFLKDWQIPLFKYVFNTDGKITSSKAHKWLKLHENEDFHRSRTSVIFFLQDLVEEGWLTRTEEDGKGGAHEVFRRMTDLNGILMKMQGKSDLIFVNLRSGV